jgi:hypothetical protein
MSPPSEELRIVPNSVAIAALARLLRSVPAERLPVATVAGAGKSWTTAFAVRMDAMKEEMD